MAALSGMTGFARREGAHAAWTWAVEARSVNGRNLETRFRGPPGFEGLDRAVREAAQARFQRGQINVSIQGKRADSQGKARVNLDEINRLVALGQPFVASGQVRPPSFDGLLCVRGVLETVDEADDEEARRAVEAAMAASIEAAFDGLKLAREEEGKALTGVLLGLVDRIEALTQQAETLAAAQGPALKDRFAKRMSELIGEGAGAFEERIVQEAALLAVKADVREEIDRLIAHVVSARAQVGDGGPVGRRLDFLAQEFMRESNTLCSKSAAAALTTVGLDLKAVVEQFREQIQNVE
jgi:uncharacterized protein (TIGR00255 family)